jgi:hypothetical protein
MSDGVAQMRGVRLELMPVRAGSMMGDERGPSTHRINNGESNDDANNEEIETTSMIKECDE